MKLAIYINVSLILGVEREQARMGASVMNSFLSLIRIEDPSDEISSSFLIMSIMFTPSSSGYTIATDPFESSGI